MDKKGQPPLPNEDKPAKPADGDKAAPGEELYSDGSGGAFSATEDVQDEKENKPLPPDHGTPY